MRDPSPEQHENEPDRTRSTLSRRDALLGMAATGGAGALTVGGFSFARGWLAPPEQLTATELTDRLEKINGRHDGFRRNHAKGLSASGTFTSTGDAQEISEATVFRPATFPVVGRFSLSGGMPYTADAANTVRGFALQITLPYGEQWRTAMVSIPVFLDRTPEEFITRMSLSKPDPNTGRPDQKLLTAYLADHPGTVAAMKIVHAQTPSSGFENSTFHGLNAFAFTNADGATVPVRWRMVPDQDYAPTTSASPSEDYLFESLIQASAAGPLTWRLVLTIGERGDPTDDATTPWPKNRRTITAGSVTIDSVETEQAGNARDVNFNPLVLPAGIAPLDDPLLAARSSVYIRSFTRRVNETKHPSQVNVGEVRGES
ncbi:catalase family peroxidase [Paramicrobacterium chengjingii]|uniref:catalase family peroxidase n=1 Tax=Paramicrobacterium chengjingii TaxID=2769067 RepID=UPI001AB03FCB|nr:catalase family peroxidase [Microbacterium chengjingii]